MALDKIRLNGVLNGRVNAMGINGGSGGESSGGIKLLTVTINPQAGRVTLNATYNQVRQAMQAGQFVGFYREDEGFYDLFLAFGYADAEGPTTAEVVFANASSMNVVTYTFVADSEDGELYLLEQH